MAQRRYLVGEVGGNPGWGLAILRSWGCQHEASARKLFERLASDREAGDVFIFDRLSRKILARNHQTTPDQDAKFIEAFIRT